MNCRQYISNLLEYALAQTKRILYLTWFFFQNSYKFEFFFQNLYILNFIFDK